MTDPVVERSLGRTLAHHSCHSLCRGLYHTLAQRLRKIVCHSPRDHMFGWVWGAACMYRSAVRTLWGKLNERLKSQQLQCR